MTINKNTAVYTHILQRRYLKLLMKPHLSQGVSPNKFITLCFNK